MFKLFRNMPNSYKIYDYIPSTKKNIKHISYPVYNQYETIDFVPQIFKTKPLIVKPTEYKIPNVPYDEQYENRDC